MSHIDGSINKTCSKIHSGVDSGIQKVGASGQLQSTKTQRICMRLCDVAPPEVCPPPPLDPPQGHRHRRSFHEISRDVRSRSKCMQVSAANFVSENYLSLWV